MWHSLQTALHLITRIQKQAPHSNNQCQQAVDEEAEPGTEEDFGGGILRKRGKASRQIKQNDAEAAALQQVRFWPQQSANICHTVLHWLSSAAVFVQVSCISYQAGVQCCPCKLRSHGAEAAKKKCEHFCSSAHQSLLGDAIVPYCDMCIMSGAVLQSLDEYFGSDQPLSEGDQFLKQYVVNKVRFVTLVYAHMGLQVLGPLPLVVDLSALL